MLSIYARVADQVVDRLYGKNPQRKRTESENRLRGPCGAVGRGGTSKWCGAAGVRRSIAKVLVPPWCPCV